MDNDDETFLVFRCRFNVQRFAYAIACVGIVFSVFMGFVDYAYGQTGSYVMSLFSAMTYAFIILAQKNKNPKLYLPYLVLQAVNIAILSSIFLFFIYAGLALPPWYLEIWQKTFEAEGMKLNKDQLLFYIEYITLVFVIVGAVYLLVVSTIYYLVFKAYRFLKGQYELPTNNAQYDQLLVGA
ncbi:hypothetical protein Ddc_20220 [Ditylenchus destructor]|nr:hypothetical protein Ddc_20220 [Ditylenchus destructor]